MRPPAAMSEVIRVATRASPLARWQVDHVAGLLTRHRPELAIEVVPVSTEGDRRRDVPISAMGGKGVFAKEVQRALLDGRADVAVHSAKDLTSTQPEGLVIAAVPPRGEPRDALVGTRLADIPARGTIATGSARRRAQLAGLRGDLTFADLRGNMATRLEKAAGFDAIVVAAAALGRIGHHDRIAEILAADRMVPQAGQGSLAVECRRGDETLLTALGAIDDPVSRWRLTAEQAFLARLGGDCDLPAGAHARIPGGPAGLDGDPARVADAGARPAGRHPVGDDPEAVEADGMTIGPAPAPGTELTLVGVLAGDDHAEPARATATGTDATALGREVADRLRAAVGG